MQVQCVSCGFHGSFVGATVECPTTCPVCKRGVLTSPVEVSACDKCGSSFPLTDSTCPVCFVERLTRGRSIEAPQNAPQPSDK